MSSNSQLTFLDVKEFSKDFYQNILKIIETNDFNTFENNLIEWINSFIKDTKMILESMQNHEEYEFWFSSIIGFFYQHGIGCNVDKNKALEFYLLIVNNNHRNDDDDDYNDDNNNDDESLNLLKENDEFIILKNINYNIGKYLLSTFYYKDIILDDIHFRNAPDFIIKYLKLARRDDSTAQCNLGHCYEYGEGEIVIIMEEEQH
ncbi:unnamed protein product [Rhizophagus irregularis]|nr:unnamed protein product [Rhizophagus irregularis]